MKTNDAKKIIESFYDGTISQREELLLFNYFNSDQVAEELLGEKEIFLQLTHREKNIEVPTRLEAKLNNLIDKLAEEEAPKKTRLKQLKLWLSVAASVAALLSLGLYMNSLSIEDNTQIVKRTTHRSNLAITDAEYMQAEDAMRLLSSNFNKGMQQIDDMKENLEKTNKILNETFKKN